MVKVDTVRIVAVYECVRGFVGKLENINVLRVKAFVQSSDLSMVNDGMTTYIMSRWYPSSNIEDTRDMRID